MSKLLTQNKAVFLCVKWRFGFFTLTAHCMLSFSSRFCLYPLYLCFKACFLWLDHLSRTLKRENPTLALLNILKKFCKPYPG